MTYHEPSIEDVLTNEEFLLGSDPEGFLESTVDFEDSDFVGDKNDCEDFLAQYLNFITGKMLKLM